jgi:hypothetical protein
MMMPVGSVGMTVLHLLLRGVANPQHLDFEVQGLAREWMVTVNMDLVAFEFLDGEDDRLTARTMGFKLHPWLELNIFRKLGPVYRDPEFGAAFAIAFPR